MEHIMNPFVLQQLKFINYFSHSLNNLVTAIEARIQLLYPTHSFSRKTTYRVKVQENHVTHLKNSLNFVPICIYLLLIWGTLNIILKCLKDVLTFLNPFLSFESPIIAYKKEN